MSAVDNELTRLYTELESYSYFQLDESVRKAILPDGQHLTSAATWSFVPHPEVLDRVAGDLKRHIVIIDTQASSVYFPVLKFIESHDANVTGYFSGGWADFVCDVRLGEKKFNVWVEELRKVLRDAGAENFCPPRRGVDALISIFAVNRSHMLCRRIVSDVGSPTPAVITEIKQNPGHFELAYRNYLSEDCVSAFGGEKAVESYLTRLREQGAILGFRARTNFSRYLPRDCVAMRIRTNAIARLLEAARSSEDLLRPVEEFLQVQVVQVADDSEENISHFFINSYKLPGERLDWKLQLYHWANPEGPSTNRATDVNVYNYDLQGTVKETPTYISDYPEYLERQKHYRFLGQSKGYSVGRAFHPLNVGVGPEAFFPIDGLPFHGITLGLPDTGKTNTDLVLARSLLAHVRRVVVLDGTRGIWSKLPDSWKIHATRIESERYRPLNLRKAFDQACAGTGLVVLEVPRKRFGEALEVAIDAIENKDDRVPDNQPRIIENVLLVEEAADAWLGKNQAAKRRVASFLRFLDKASRKGWCVWLSSQRPSQLGPDETTSNALLRMLKNWVLHKLDNEADISALVTVLREDGHSMEDLDYLRQNISSAKGQALLRGVKRDQNGGSTLRPILAKVPLLQDLLKGV